NSPDENLNNLLAALWYDAKNNWDKAHEITQDIEGKDSAWVHAYLHRREGDNGNASYWYSRAGKSFPDKTLEEEWEEIVSALLVKQE
ncbi:MAG: hypothetical protein EHM47_11745, partial [Ignavibacteriales bacterium]